MIFRRKKFIFSLLAFLILAFYQRLEIGALPNEKSVVLSEKSGKEISQNKREEAKIIRVIDGDTVEVLLSGQKEKVRVIGINTPETIDPRRPVQCFGKEASSHAKEILTEQNVVLESDSTQTNRDKYNRLLRYIFLNEVDFGKSMIAEGFAYEYTYNIPYKYQSDYKEAEKEARNAQKGLWANNACAKKS